MVASIAVARRALLWLDRTVFRSVTVRQIVLGVVIAMVAVAVRWRWDGLVRAHIPYVDVDTKVFEEIAERPLDLGLVFDSKPLIVPLVYRVTGSVPIAIARIQAELAFASWAILTLALMLVVRWRWTRAIAIGVGAVFILAPLRVGYTGSLLPESINDSLMALTLAGALAVLRLRGRWRIAASLSTGLVGILWLLTRDTNAFVVASAAAVLMVMHRGWKSFPAWALSALVATACGLVLWTTTVGREPLPSQRSWDPRFTPRGVGPLVHNILWRVYPEERDALPIGLAPFAPRRGSLIEQFFTASPEVRPLQDWFLDHGASIYARWLVRHPVDRLRELVTSRWTLLAPRWESYMPDGWDRGTGSLRALTSNRWLVLLLLVASPLLLWRPRADLLRGAALCVVLSGAVGILASYYGDADEVARHCFGSGQQVVVGLFLAALAWVDRLPRLVDARRSRQHPSAAASGAP